MNVFINGTEISSALITINSGLNFSRFDAEELIVKSYTINIDFQEFVDVIEATYNFIRDEIKLDDLEQNEISEFSKTGYCSLNVLMNHKEDLKKIILNYLDRPLLEKLVISNQSAIYVINSTDRIEIENSIVKISGRLFEKTPPV